MRARAFFGVLSVFIAMLWISPARGASHCLVATEGACRLKVDQLGFRIQVDERGQIVVVFGNTLPEIERAESYVIVQEDLDRLETNQIYTPNEAAQIRAELTNYDGTAYVIPDADELKAALNLPTTETVSAHDFMDLIQVHMQLVLSFSAFTTNYLGELMGIAVLEAAPAAPVAPVAPAVLEAPSAAPEIPPTPTPLPTPAPASVEIQTQS